MVTTTDSYADERYRALAGDLWDGVVRVSAGGGFGSGVLLYGGRAVLTAAHVLQQANQPPTVHFETAGGRLSVQALGFELHPAFDSVNMNRDLALVWLPSAAPLAAIRHEIYRSSDERGQAFDFAGYGMRGTGDTGALANLNTGTPVRLHASNRFDVDTAEVKSVIGSGMAWRPLAGTTLTADFDNGLASNDALGSLVRRTDFGLGTMEGLIAPGDSGGPAWIDGKVAGIASYSFALKLGVIHPDIDDAPNSSFGEMAAWQRVSAHQQWIDQSLRASYTDAPQSRQEIEFRVQEGQQGTRYAYFWLEFSGMRQDESAWLSVDYETRDGSATAGQDYIGRDGTLVLYPGESHAVIPIEIIGDTVVESDESFYLAVFNPVGGALAGGQAELVAMRTIVNDDGWSA